MKLLNKLATWKVIVPLSVLYILFPSVIFRHYQSVMAEMAQGTVQILDLRLSYSWQEVKALFDQLGTDGRDVYRTVSNSIDMIYPLLYCALLILVLAFLLKKVTSARSKWMYLSFIPIIGMLFDFLENLSILDLLNKYPNFTAADVASASFFTTLKWSSMALVFGTIFVLFLLYLYKRRKPKSA